jgi:Ca-activated chloride channel family protein
LPPWRRILLKRVGLVAVMLAAAPLMAQKPPAPDQKPFPPVAEKVEVSVTNVEVVVTDSKGNRVAGLTRDDFEVYQDGTPQKISNFYAVSGGKASVSIPPRPKQRSRRN